MADKPLGARQMKEYYERGSGVNSSAAEASQRGPPAASLGPINTNFPRRFLCCLLPLPIQCMHKPKRELVNIFVGDTAHLRVSGKSVCHFLQDFLTGGSGTGFEKEWNLQFAINTSKPPAPVTLEGRLCQSGKPHEYKRSLVWLNLPYPTNWEDPKVRRPPLSISILQRRQAPLHPTSLPQ